MFLGKCVNQLVPSKFEMFISSFFLKFLYYNNKEGEMNKKGERKQELGKGTDQGKET